MTDAVNVPRFLRTGHFGRLRYPADQAQVLSVFGLSTTGGDVSQQQHSSIWRYGDVEFFFDPSTTALTGIFTDHENLLQGADGLCIAPWRLHRGMTLRHTMDVLTDTSITYTLEEKTHQPTGLYLKTEGDVRLYFERPVQATLRLDWPLVAISFDCPVASTERRKQLHLTVNESDFQALGQLAQKTGISREDIVRRWIHEKISEIDDL